MTTLVLLPGMDGTGLLFADFIAALGADFEVRVCTYPSDRAVGYAELEALARAFLPRDRPFTMLAESFSGPLAISIAASSPPGLRALVLCCSFSRNPRPLLARFGTMFNLVPTKLLSAFAGTRLLLGRSSTVGQRTALRRALAIVSPSTLAARLKALAKIDVSDKLRQLHIPILYLRATKDYLVPRAACKQIVRMAPHTQIADIDGPHLLLQAAPIPAARVVAEFSRSAAIA
jgi:pimeloyl-ACP methyl ester carboxylesterase